MAARRKTAAKVITPSRKSWWPYAAGIAAAVFLVFQAYAPAMHGPFVFDDRFLPYGKDLVSPHWQDWIKGLRPLLMFSFWLNHTFWNDPFGFHFVNVGLHLLNGFLVYSIVRSLLSRARQQAAAFAAAVFLLHPVQTEAVAYIAGRSELLSVFFFLAAFAVFLRARQSGVSWPAAISILLLYVAAVASKEHALVLPGLFLLTDLYWSAGRPWDSIRRNWRVYAPLAAACLSAPILVIRILSGARSAGFHLSGFTWYQYFFTECRSFFVYLRLLIIPTGQNADWDYAISRSILDHGAIFALAAILLLLAAALYFRKRYPLASFGFLVYLLLLAPTSSFVPIQDPIAERRLYLPMIGLLLVLADWLSRLALNRRARAIACAAIVLALAALTFERSHIWSSDTALWEDTVQKSPGKARAHIQLAFAYYAAGRCAEAVTEYREVARLQTPDAEVLTDWGLAHECAGKPDEAVARLREAAALKPTAHILSQIALVYARRGRWPDALAALAAAEKLDPNYAIIYFYRGGVEAANGQFAAATADYEHALHLDPRNEPARQALDYARQRIAPPRR